MFRTAPLSFIRIFSLYTQQWYMSYRICWQLASRIRTELRPDPAGKLSENLNVTSGAQVRSQATPCDIYGRQSVIGKGVSPLSFRHYCIIVFLLVPLLFGRQAGEFGDLRKKQCVSWYSRKLDRNVLVLLILRLQWTSHLLWLLCV